MQKTTKLESRHTNENENNNRPTMFSLERLLIAFSAFLGDSISKTPKVHVLICLCVFGLLAVGMVLVEIEHDVFKLWVSVFVSFSLVQRCFSLFFLSIVGTTHVTETTTRVHETEERVRSTLSFVLSFSLLNKGGGRENEIQFPLLFTLIFRT